jgi:hypothetical protein
MSIRPGHEWYRGDAGKYTSSQLERLCNRFVACPGCSRDDFALGKCHTVALISEFKQTFPDLEPPTFVSMATKLVEGKGGLRDVLIAKDAVFCGCSVPRGAPTKRDLGLYLPESVFGNPAKSRKKRAREE